jgi:hypothetical protein
MNAITATTAETSGVRIDKKTLLEAAWRGGAGRAG